MLTPTWITQAAWFTSSKSTCINLCFYYSLAELQKKKTSFFDNHSSSWVDEVVHDKAKYYWFSITCNYDGWCSWGQRLNKSGHVNLTQWQLWGKHWLQRKNGIDFKIFILVTLQPFENFNLSQTTNHLIYHMSKRSSKPSSFPFTVGQCLRGILFVILFFCKMWLRCIFWNDFKNTELKNVFVFKSFYH